MLCQTSVNNIYCAVEIFFFEREKRNCKPGGNLGLQSMKKIHLKYGIAQTKRNNIYCAVEIFFLEREAKKNCKPGGNLGLQ